MNKQAITDLSSQLKTISKDLSFLGNPRYPLKSLYQLFPQHKDFIHHLEDESVPFSVNSSEKKRKMDDFQKNLMISDISPEIRKIFNQRICDYKILLSMMDHFGTHLFYDHCLELYGNSHKLIQNNSFLYFTEEIPRHFEEDNHEKEFSGEEAQKYLTEKLLETFDRKDFEVKASSSLLSDSSAGRRTLKINPHKIYSKGELDIFLVHEGWAHLGTSINGTYQDEHPWLATWAPRTTHFQEGLAILTEIITGKMTRERWNKILIRHLATSMAERGSSITDVYGYLRHHGLGDLDAFKLALRVFRGVPLEGGMAFTKELLYLHGMVELLLHLNFYKTDLRSLFIGKVSFEEHVILLDQWKKLNPKLKFFPKELEDPLVLLKLEKLKELSVNLFKAHVPEK